MNLYPIEIGTNGTAGHLTEVVDDLGNLAAAQRPWCRRIDHRALPGRRVDFPDLPFEGFGGRCQQRAFERRASRLIGIVAQAACRHNPVGG
uniref:hypothetical protein n=1 Tax=Pseudomonas bambusae TaxID=3139142 RepID=UPI0040389F89